MSSASAKAQRPWNVAWHKPGPSPVVPNYFIAEPVSWEQSILTYITDSDCSPASGLPRAPVHLTGLMLGSLQCPRPPITPLLMWNSVTLGVPGLIMLPGTLLISRLLKWYRRFKAYAMRSWKTYWQKYLYKPQPFSSDLCLDKFCATNWDKSLSCPTPKELKEHQRKMRGNN